MNAAIRLEQVDKSLGQRQILKDVSFTVEPGDIFGYLGPNGAGKTTTIRIILGLFYPDSGQLKVLGRDVSREPEVKKNIGFVLEADGLYDNLTARENLAYYGEIYEVASITDRIDEVLEAVGLLDRANDRVGTFSKGMRQRLALARAVLHDPELLILDEPTAGLDPTGQMEVRELILDLAHRGKTVFLSSHNLDEVERICNRIAIIHRGEIRTCGEVERLKGTGHRELEIRLGGPLSEEAKAALQRLSYLKEWRCEGGNLLLSLDGENDPSEVLSLLLQKGAAIDEVRRRELSLEEIYAEIVGKEAG
jgi:ABC-2 type transport system ATP-binding protein